MESNHKIPVEIILLIYQCTDIDTKIKINKLMNWRQDVKIPFKRPRIPYISKSLQERQNKYLKYYDDKFSKLYSKSGAGVYMYAFNLTPESLQPSGVINLERYYDQLSSYGV